MKPMEKLQEARPFALMHVVIEDFGGGLTRETRTLTLLGRVVTWVLLAVFTGGGGLGALLAGYGVGCYLGMRP